MTTSTTAAEREDLRAAIRSFLADRLPESAVRELIDTATGVDAGSWSRLSGDLGLAGLLVPEEYGGSGLRPEQYIPILVGLSRIHGGLRGFVHAHNSSAHMFDMIASEEQKRDLLPLVARGERSFAFGLTEPDAGTGADSKTRAVRDGDEFVVNGQKVWTSGAHDADWLLTFVRTDPDAPKHKGISVLIVPTDTPGVVCRPFADMTGQENLDFNEVFFTDARVPAENLVGPLNQGWKVANGSLGHERTMMWLGFADRIDNMLADFNPRTELERDQYATTIMDYQALRALGSAALARAARGEQDTASVSVLKLLGSEAERNAFENALAAAGPEGLIHPSTSGPYAHMNLDHYFASWFERYARSFGGTIAGGTSEIQRNIIATQVLGLPRG